MSTVVAPPLSQGAGYGVVVWYIDTRWKHRGLTVHPDWLGSSLRHRHGGPVEASVRSKGNRGFKRRIYRRKTISRFVTSSFNAQFGSDRASGIGLTAAGVISSWTWS